VKPFAKAGKHGKIGKPFGKGFRQGILLSSAPGLPGTPGRPAFYPFERSENHFTTGQTGSGVGACAERSGGGDEQKWHDETPQVNTSAGNFSLEFPGFADRTRAIRVI
jgi:hypothetical protein